MATKPKTPKPLQQRLLKQAKRNLKKGLGRRSLNELVALHLSALFLLGTAWAATSGLGSVHTVLARVCFFYALGGWVVLRIWNQHAWKKHFRPRPAPPPPTDLAAVRVEPGVRSRPSGLI